MSTNQPAAMRHYSLADSLLIQLEKSLSAVFVNPSGTRREDPAVRIPEPALTDAERRHVAGLMRVNHAGEIAAQALYNGQAVFARQAEVRERLKISADEEADHLAWCRKRVEELGSRTSLLGPFWYWGSFAIGAAASAAGDKWSLGFVKETEDQVIAHLQGHLKSLPAADHKSRAIIEQMIADEAHHGEAAVAAGGVELPLPVRLLMKATAKVMTTTSYWF